MTAPARRRSPLGPVSAGWTHIAFGLAAGVATAIGFVTAGLGAAEALFFILLACLLVAVGAFVLSLRAVLATILALSLLLFGLSVGFGLLVSGGVLGVGDGVVATALGMAGILLAALEAWSILTVWRGRAPRAVEEGKTGRGGESVDDRESGRKAGP